MAADAPTLDESGKLKASFRRAKSRASRACEICHARKVRCDVTVHMPCTNCAAFGVECTIPEGRQKRGGAMTKSAANAALSEAKKRRDNKLKAAANIAKSDVKLEYPAEDSQNDGDNKSADEDGDEPEPEQPDKTFTNDASNPRVPDEKSTRDSSTSSYFKRSETDSNHIFGSIDTIDWHFNAVKQPGSMSYLGATSNLNLIFNPAGGDSHDENSYFLLKESQTKGAFDPEVIDKEDMEVLKMKGAFLLPARELCDDIIKAFFEKVHPFCPVVNKTNFMRRYNDPANSPSLLLIQSMLVCGSKLCRNPSLFDMSGSSHLATITFYKRAKALFDCNHETDRIAAIQAALLLGWWNDEPQAAIGNVFYWTRVAVILAQGVGLHRDLKGSSIPLVDRRHLRKLWWCLFTRDRSSAVALGRPVIINLEDTDVAMLTLDDFIEDEPGKPSMYPVNKTHALAFIYQVKLSEIMGLVLHQQFSIDAEASRRMNRVVDVSQCDLAMASWINSLPVELKYSVKEKRSHNFVAAYLHLQYYTILCLVHRSNILHRPVVKSDKVPDYPSWGIAFQAAHMITRILDMFMKFRELDDCPAFIVYATFSAMILLIYQTESSSKNVKEVAQRALSTCTAAMEEISNHWGSARAILMLFKVLNKDQTLRKTVVNSAKRFTSDDNGGSVQPIAASSIATVTSVGGDFKRPGDNVPGKDIKRSKVAESPSSSSNAGISPSDERHHHINIPTSDSPVNSNHRPGVPDWHTGTRSIQNPATYSSFAPELFLVTNTSPDNQIASENFKPSQLFPETGSSGSQSGRSTNHHTPQLLALRANGAGSDDGEARSDGSGAQNDFGYSDMFINVDTAGYLADNSMFLSEDTLKNVPNNINIGDWYQFLLKTTGDSLIKNDEKQ